MPTKKDSIIVGLDLDGVIIDHTQNKMRIALRYGATLRPEETHSETMRAMFDADVYHEMQSQLYDDTPEALDAPLMEGAFAGLATLRERGIPYFLISRRKDPMSALHLIERRGLWGEYFTPENTFFVESPEEKNDLAKMLHVTHYIDDEIGVLRAMSVVPCRILYDQRALFEDEKEFLHVRNWVEVVQVLNVGMG